MPVLNWIGKDKVVNHDKELPFRVLKPVRELSVGNDNENLLVEGDNLEALKALMPFYYNKVKCIYIDPPYNTGNEKWIYNDKVNSPQIKAWFKKVVGAEGEDLCRHDKWLCMMYPRLKLLKQLLKDDGLIFISIDDNEVANLKTIMNDIFVETNFVTQFVWQKAAGTQNDNNYVAINHEYILCYAKDITKINLFKLPPTEEMLKGYTLKDKYVATRGKHRLRNLNDFSIGDRPGLHYDITCPDGVVLKGNEHRWRCDLKRFHWRISEDRIIFKKNKNDEWDILYKQYINESKEKIIEDEEGNILSYGKIPISLLLKVGFTGDGKKEIKEILGLDVDFPYPKPSSLIKHLLTMSSRNNDIVLDSFAGSGTTGQAVLELNKEDGGNRKFILVELERDIAKKVTAKRLKKVIKGYEGAKFPDGTTGGFEYLDLNGVLYDYSGYVNPDAHYEDMAAYIYFTETRNYLDIETIKNPYIGSQGSTHYFLFFKGKGNNILDEETLKQAGGVKGAKVVYADKCLIDEENLAKRGVVFKQIPYELKKY